MKLITYLLVLIALIMTAQAFRFRNQASRPNTYARTQMETTDMCGDAAAGGYLDVFQAQGLC